MQCRKINILTIKERRPEPLASILDTRVPFEKMDLEHKAIERIKMASEMSLYHYGQPLVCTYSGGKDSDVIRELFKRSGVPYELHNSHTTVDAPQTVYHIRDVFRDAELGGIKAQIEMPKYKGNPVTMWSLISQKGMPPSRLMRYCCQVLKETGCANRYIATGVRWDESNQRAERQAYETNTRKKQDAIRLSDEVMLMNDNSDKRRMLEHCHLKGKMIVNPIIDWTHRDIWDFIHTENISYNCLYDMGYKRVGCIGCPMAGKGRWKEFADFPTYQRAYIRAFDKMLETLREKGASPKWKTGHDIFLWWMEDKNVEGQMDLFEDGFIR